MRPVPSHPQQPPARCRHAVAAVGPFIFLYGGLVGSTLHSDLLLADDGVMKDTATYDARSPPWLKWLETTNQAASMLAQNAAEEAKAAGTLLMHRASMEEADGGSGDDLAAEAEAAQSEAAQRQLANQGAEGEEGEQQVHPPSVFASVSGVFQGSAAALCRARCRALLAQLSVSVFRGPGCQFRGPLVQWSACSTVAMPAAAEEPRSGGRATRRRRRAARSGNGGR